MHRLTIVWNKDERKLVDGGAYLVLTRENKVKVCQWQNGRGAFYTERDEGRQGEWTESLSVHSVAGWTRIEDCKFEFVNTPKNPPKNSQPPKPKVEPEEEQ